MAMLDDVDLAILAFVADHRDSTVTDGAKALFHPGDTDELQKRDAMLRHRYKGLAAAELLAVRQAPRRALYRLNRKRIRFGHGLRSLDLGGVKHDDLGIGRDYCIAVLLGDGVLVRSLDTLEQRWGLR